MSTSVALDGSDFVADADIRCEMPARANGTEGTVPAHCIGGRRDGCHRRCGGSGGC